MTHNWILWTHCSCWTYNYAFSFHWVLRIHFFITYYDIFKERLTKITYSSLRLVCPEDLQCHIGLIFMNENFFDFSSSQKSLYSILHCCLFFLILEQVYPNSSLRPTYTVEICGLSPLFHQKRCQTLKLFIDINWNAIRLKHKFNVNGYVKKRMCKFG